MSYCIVRVHCIACQNVWDEQSGMIGNVWMGPSEGCCPRCKSNDIQRFINQSNAIKSNGLTSLPLALALASRNLDTYAHEAHEASKKWWVNLETGEPIERNTGQLLMLCVSELAEAMEGDRKNLMDDKLPHRKMFDVELVDCFIRLADIFGAKNIPFEEIYQEKMAYNAQRADHKTENRKLNNGKKY